MIALKIRHKTLYRFRQPVSLGAHRLMLRPRESRDLRLMSHTLEITPAPVLTWAHDVFGNAVAMATFATMADVLMIDSVADILLNAEPGRYSTSPPPLSRTPSAIPTKSGPTLAHWRPSNTRIRRDDCASGRVASSAAIRRIPFPCSRI